MFLHFHQEGANYNRTLWFGHAGLTHGYLLRGDSVFVCIQCGVPIANVDLVQVSRYYEERHTFHLRGMLRDILMDV
jgi:hypothetical protein